MVILIFVFFLEKNNKCVKKPNSLKRKRHKNVAGLNRLMGSQTPSW